MQTGTADSTCEPCAHGTASAVGVDLCPTCDPGQYTTAAGLTGCLDCARGKYLEALTLPTTIVECKTCGVGEVSTESKATICTACGSGQVPNVDQKACVACQPGTFKPHIAAGVCETCAKGAVAQLQQDTCIPCADAKVPDFSNATCVDIALVPCEAGERGNGESCVACSVGRYGQPGKGTKTTCTDCGLGEYASEPKLTACTSCEVDKVTGIDYTASECTYCPAGTVRDQTFIACSPCAVGTHKWLNASANSSYTCNKCAAGKVAALGSDSCSVCNPGSIPDLAQSDCSPCPVGEYATLGATACSECGTRGMDCGGGVLTILPGWWYDSSIATSTTPTPRRRLDAVRQTFSVAGTTPVFPCLNPEACTVVNNTIVVCASHSTGPLCAVCEDGYVPDASAVDGSCKTCDSSLSERWLSKSAILSIGAVIFFFIGLYVISRPAPKLKIDWLLMKLNTRRIVRRLRKRGLHRMVEREHAVADNGVSDEVRAQCVKLLNENKVDAMVEFRRGVFAAEAAGLAAASLRLGTLTSSRGAPGRANVDATAANVVDAARHIEDDAIHRGEDRVTGDATDALTNMIGAPDVDGSLDTEGMRRNSLVFEGVGIGARALVGSGNASCFTDFVAQVRWRVAALVDALLMSPGQIKLVLGNLQINASLTGTYASVASCDTRTFSTTSYISPHPRNLLTLPYYSRL